MCFIIFNSIKEPLAIQACYNISDNETLKREINSLIFAMKRLNLKKGFIITFDEEKEIKINNFIIEVIPFYKFFLMKI